MSIIEIDRDPSAKTLKWFGIALLLFAGLLGALLSWRTEGGRGAGSVWVVGAVVALVYYLVVPIRRRMYIGWQYVGFPIGWLVSHLALAGVFYLIVAPIAVCMRMLGRDPLSRRFDQATSTYWVAHDPGGDQRRYFRQF